MWQKRGQIGMKRRAVILLGILIAISSAVAGYFYFESKDNETNSPIVSVPETSTDDNIVIEPEVKKFDSVGLQSVVDEWANSINGEYGVVISDDSGNVLAQANPDQEFFAASTYKLYVAYEGYKQLDAGVIDSSEIYVNGNTRLECLDLMIRESDSPCAEKLWNEIGKEKIETAIVGYGIEDTSMTALRTTASDANKILVRISNGDGLSKESQSSYLSSMKEQPAKFRRGLPSGFSSLIVYNKVGWNELIEWHDTAIIELPDGRRLIVAVFTENVGYANIAKLGASMEALLATE